MILKGGAIMDLPRVDFLLLADRAEVLNGKFYIMGGGWDFIRVTSRNQINPGAVALSVGMPPSAMAEEHDLKVSIVDAEDVAIAKMGARFSANAQPAPDRSWHHVRIAFQMAFVIQRSGTYKLRAIIDDLTETTHEIEFSAALEEEDEVIN
jgi:hypothetical protein